MADVVPLTRWQIAKWVGNDAESIRAIEELFRLVGTSASTDISALEARVTINEGNISTAQTDISQLKIDVAPSKAIAAMSAGSVVFSNGTTAAEDNANLFWDDTNNRLGIGTASPGSTFHVGGSVTTAIITVTSASFTPDATHHTIFCDCTSNVITVNLPAAASCTGRLYRIKKVDASANQVTIDPNGSETIDAVATLSFNGYLSYVVQSDGSNWWTM
jgi:hypothetical protein